MRATTRFIRILGIAGAAGVAAITVGCAPVGTHSNATLAPAQRTALRVNNHNWQDVGIYLVPESGGIPVRIGTVTSMTSALIPLRGRTESEVRTQGRARVFIKPIGSRTGFVTDAVLVSPGEEMRLIVENQLVHSTLIVRSR